jgi:hypothetical protein
MILRYRLINEVKSNRTYFFKIYKNLGPRIERNITDHEIKKSGRVKNNKFRFKYLSNLCDFANRMIYDRIFFNADLEL